MERQRYSLRELAAWCWRLSGRHGLSLKACLTAGWPLDDYDQPVLVERDFVMELPLALAEEAIADGMSAAEVLRAFADALDPVAR